MDKPSSSTKRVIECEEVDEEDYDPRPCKRRKLSDVILGTNDEQRLKLDEAVRRRRKKLLKAVRKHRSYGYHCTKHDVTYRLEKKRQDKKISSRKSRDGLLDSFRSLKVDTEKLEDDDDDDDNNNNDPMIISSTEQNLTPQLDNNPFRKTSTPVIHERKRKNSMNDQEQIFEEMIEQEKENNQQQTIIKKFKVQPKCYDLFKGKSEEDSDYDTDCRCQNRKKFKVHLVKKISGMMDVYNYSETEEYEVGDTEKTCDCPHHDMVSEILDDYCEEDEHESSSSSGCDDDYDKFSFIPIQQLKKYRLAN